MAFQFRLWDLGKLDNTNDGLVLSVISDGDRRGRAEQSEPPLGSVGVSFLEDGGSESFSLAHYFY